MNEGRSGVRSDLGIKGGSWIFKKKFGFNVDFSPVKSTVKRQGSSILYGEILYESYG